MRAVSAVAVLSMLLLTGCAATPSPGTVAGQSQATGEAGPSEAVDSADVTFEIEQVDRFDSPWAMTFLPDGDLLVTERDGALTLRNQRTGERTKISGLPDIAVAGQGGLGDVLPAPSFVDDGGVFLTWVESGDGGTGAVVGRARLDRAAARLVDIEVIWRQWPKVSGDGHFSHRLAISPDGASLFVSSGDRQQFDPAQNLDNTLGTIVRLTLDGDPAPGNPFADAGGRTAQIYSYGHRNPLGLAFAPDGSLWSSEMGPQGGDELNLIEPGGNYGWPDVSNGSHYGGAEIPDHGDADGFVAPRAWWNPSISPGSLMIYDGDEFAPWQGDAFLGALSGEALVRVDLDGMRAVSVQTWPMGERIREVEQAADGSIWILEDAGSGRLLRLTRQS